MKVSIIEADLSRAAHQAATIALLNAYSMDPMADAAPLSEAATRAYSWLARVPHHAGLSRVSRHGARRTRVLLHGFSTFAARLLVNTHDFFVATAQRDTGISRMLRRDRAACA